MTNQTITPIDDGELDNLLNKLVAPFDTSDMPPGMRITSPSLKIAQAKAELNAYILAEMLKIIGPNEYRGPVLYKEVRNKLRNQLRAKTTARFGGEK